MKRYGIFGGTFNPPHVAHLIHAESVRSQMSLDKIIFIPSYVPPLKENSHILDIKHRLAMTKLTFEKNKNFEVSDIEITQGTEKSYTVKTLLKLKEKYKSDFVKLFLIIGMDNLIDLPKWKEPGKLFGMSEVIVINRPGYYVDKAPEEFVRRVIYVPVPSLEISSTSLRALVKEKKSIKYLVTE